MAFLWSENLHTALPGPFTDKAVNLVLLQESSQAWMCTPPSGSGLPAVIKAPSLLSQCCDFRILAGSFAI